MNTYLVALFVHVVAVFGLIAAVAVTITCLASAQRACETSVVRSWTAVAAGADRAIPAVTAVILISAIYMVRDAWSWESGWIVVSLVEFGVLSVVGPAVNARRFNAIHRLAAASPDGPVPPALAKKLSDPVLGTSVRTMTAAMVGAAYLMVMKPSLAGSVTAIAVSVAFGLVASIPLLAGSRGTPAVRSAPVRRSSFGERIAGR